MKTQLAGESAYRDIVERMMRDHNDQTGCRGPVFCYPSHPSVFAQFVGSDKTLVSGGGM